MENNISAINEYASDLQAFLGSKMIETEIQKYETFLQSLFDDGSLRMIDINCKIDDKITDVLPTVTSLGSVSIESSFPLVFMKTGKEIKAQNMSCQCVPISSINDITMALQSKFQFNLITGCCFSFTEDAILVQYDYQRLLILKEDGTLKNEISLSPSTPIVTCCSLTREKMWEYKDQLVSSPRGIDVDKNLNIYIASNGNNSVVVLSPDGKQARKLLGKDDGIGRPFGLAFDVKKENLLVVNFVEPAFYRLS
ncbi:Hypothetical predicted protein [Mytilus galloprovincialis]|uniref:Uncharacterized protein n=1 Tax=Mytilus galloprovincialis TaxID=29158 RepID=A0A8B6GMG1_MYTGA|nr:Hypothetical predicted protein [Mytilus galloprovincialis]